MYEDLADLADEQAELETLLRGLRAEQWRVATPSAGWDVRDQVSHLADCEQIAFDTVTGGPRSINNEAARFATPEDFTESMCQKGRTMAPDAVLAWWVDGAARLRALLGTLDPKQRVPWGLGMSARAFVSARLMEHWAHGLDIRAAAGVAPQWSPRLRNVAWLITNAAEYAFQYAGREKPPGSLRVRLHTPEGPWTFGPADATNEISGDALEYCILGVQRMKRAEALTLEAHGPLANATLDVLRAFL